MSSNVKTTPRKEVTVSSQYTNNISGSSSNETIVRSFEESGMYGENIRNFHKRRKAGELLPHTDFFQYEMEGSATRTESVVRVSDGKTVSWSNGAFYPTSRWSIPDHAPLDSAWAPDPGLLASLLKDVTGTINNGGVNVGNILGELGRTASMVKNIGNLAERLTSGKSSKDIANLYLEGRYGWTPLIRDIRDLIDALQRIDEKDETRVSQRSGYSVREAVAPSYEVSTNASYFTGEWGYDDDIEISHRASVTADIQVQLFRINPFVTAWEVLPFSFVIDWLLDVGSSIEAASFLFTNKQYAASVGYNIQLTRTPFHSVSFKSGYTGVSSVSGESSLLMQRRIPSSVSISPRFRPRIRPLNVLDSLALVRQRLG